MGIPVNIMELINSRVVESSRIEFKADFNPEPVIHTICAFANDIDNMGGGYLVIGVSEENGSPVFPVKGIEQERIDGILNELTGYCRLIEPMYNPICEPVLIDDKYIIVIWVPGGYGRPYKAPKNIFTDKAAKYFYIRKFSSTMIASSEEERELFYISSSIPFDDRPNLLADVSDLDLGLLRSHLRETGSGLLDILPNSDAYEIAENMHLLSGSPEMVHPVNAAVLMFCENPEKYFRYARIEIVDIPDPTGQGMTEKIFTGPIQRQLKDALQYIKNYVIKEMVRKSGNRAEAERVYNYPFRAVEEILSNAVYHRSYQVNEPITVRITPDRMEIMSFPGFDRSITAEAIDNLDIRARAYRNRRIGEYLKELHLIEGRNTGFPNAVRALSDNGSSMPEFIMDDERTFLSVVLHVHPVFLQPKSGKAEKKMAYEESIKERLLENPATLTELSRAMGYKGITKKLSTAVEDMIRQEQIECRVCEGKQIRLFVK